MKYNLKSFWRQDFLLGYLSFMVVGMATVERPLTDETSPHLLHSIYRN